MKKLYVSLFAVLFAFNANAFDLGKAANQLADGADKTARAIEAQKELDAGTKAAIEAKKAEAKAKLEAELEAKKAEAEHKMKAKQAHDEAKKAEAEAELAKQKQAVEDAKDSLNNLKNAFSK